MLSTSVFFVTLADHSRRTVEVISDAAATLDELIELAEAGAQQADGLDVLDIDLA